MVQRGSLGLLALAFAVGALFGTNWSFFIRCPVIASQGQPSSQQQHQQVLVNSPNDATCQPLQQQIKCTVSPELIDFRHIMTQLIDSAENGDVEAIYHLIRRPVPDSVRSKCIATESPPSPSTKLPIGVVILCYNRPDYLQRTLDSLSRLPQLNRFHVFVSQDGDDESVKNVVEQWQQDHELTYFQFHYDKDSWIATRGKNQFFAPHLQVYFKISAHFYWMFNQVFNSDKGIEKLIILEDDMELSVDFFDYFLAQSKVLDLEESVMCVSAWNDHGQRGHVSDPQAVYKSDVFPGLGWMLSKKLWDEFEPKWPGGYWDDWIREDSNSKGRACLFPEVNRVYTFGEKGSSQGQFFDTYLRNIQLNDVPVNWSAWDPSSMSKRNYDKWLSNLLERGTVVSARGGSVEGSGDKDTPVIVKYTGEGDFPGNEFGLISEFKAGKPRASYKGVVFFRVNGQLVALVPKSLSVGE